MPDMPNDAMTIMIVDDAQLNIDILRKVLTPEGYLIVTETSGGAALESAPRLKPDLILLDVMMPGINGFETCRRLKQHEATRDIPVIFITAKTDTTAILEGFKVGGLDYIRKPFEFDEVRVRLRTHIQAQMLLRNNIRLVEELETKNQRLEDINALKNKFLGIAAHDLRNPLSSIRGFSELLMGDESELSSEQRNEFLKTIYNLSDYMLILVNDMLDIAVIENGGLNLRLVASSLTQLINERVRVNQLMANGKHIHIHTEISDTPEMQFDTYRISQVLDNLLGNAIKFSPCGKNLWVSAGVRDSMAHVSVQDEGPGLTDEDQTKLEGDFQRLLLSPAPTAGEKSTGLGLAIVKSIMKAHGGELNVVSQLGRGSTFTVTLPLEHADEHV